MSNPDENLTASGDQSLNEPTLKSLGEETTEPSPPVQPQESTLPAPSSEETVVGASVPAETVEPKSPLAPDEQSIHNQDTVVSPRLRQLAQTPGQPLRPPSGTPPKPGGLLPLGSSSRVYLWAAFVGVLILLVVALVVAVTVKYGVPFIGAIGATKTPTPTPTLAATPTSAFPPTFTPTRLPPSPTPTPVPPTATPRPAPVALAKDVLAKVTPPEGLKLKVRESPSSAAKILGELDKDTQVTIVDGPQEANGITWWKVDNGTGLVGWSAEGLGGVKYLVPVGWAK
jgi:hypothetical protein